MTKNPTLKQCKKISKELKIEPTEYLVKKWRELKGGGVEVCLIHKETGEKICEIMN